MLLGIISDTHNQVERTRLAIELLTEKGVAALFHCGDFTNREVLEACSPLPTFFVYGNNDCDTVPDLVDAAQQQNTTNLEWGGAVEIAGKKIAMTHGHLTADLKRLMQSGPDYLFSGHSHIASDSMQDGVRRINPGALFRAAELSIATLDLTEDEVEFIKIAKT